MNIDDESHLKNKFLKGIVKLPSMGCNVLRIPFLNHHNIFIKHPPASGARWLRSIRLTPDPGPEIMLQDILIGRQSIFAASGPIQARLLNRINTGSDGWSPVRHQEVITLALSGGEYNGFCEIELAEMAVVPHKFVTFLAVGAQTLNTGTIRLLVAEPTLMEAMSNPGPGESFEVSAGRGSEFSHQIFEEDMVKYQTRPGFDGIILSSGLTMEHPSCVLVRRIQGEKREEVGKHGKIVALLEYPCP